MTNYLIYQLQHKYIYIVLYYNWTDDTRGTQWWRKWLLCGRSPPDSTYVVTYVRIGKDGTPL